MSDIDLTEHLAALAFHHGVEFDDEDLAVFSQAAQRGVGPDEMEQLVERYVADVYESDDDDDDDFADDNDEIEDVAPPETGEAGSILGRVAAIQDHVGRRLTTAELESVESALASRTWNVERVAAEAGIKGIDEMSHAEKTAWMVGRVNDINPPPELEIPATADGSPDFDAMDRNQINAYMVARAEGAEFAETE